MSQAKNLSPEAFSNLEELILNGPPRSMYSEDIDSNDRDLLVKDSVWRRLVKLVHDETMLSPTARSILEEKFPNPSDWKIERNNERTEFSYWIMSTGLSTICQQRLRGYNPAIKFQLNVIRRVHVLGNLDQKSVGL